MVLSDSGLISRESWEQKGYILPDFDRKEMRRRTKEEPVWVHFGAGNIFRAFHAAAAQKLLDAGLMTSGITVVEGFDAEIIEKTYRPHDDLSILVTLKSDGTVEKTVVASVGESCILDSGNEREFSRLKEIFRAPSLQLATFTITEKGYSLTDATGKTAGTVASDFEIGPQKPQSYMGKVTALLYERFLASLPICMLSCDNCSHNGDRLRDAVRTFAKEWENRNLCKEGFSAYIDDASQVSFPWSMIDKITPRPDDVIASMLDGDGVEDINSIVTSANTYVAPFVNAEECEYLVIEDDFPAGRPKFESAGFILTDRDTVDRAERMKVCTCLNPLHTSLAVFGCLLGFSKISEEMEDSQLRRLAERIGYEEGLPVSADPKVIDPKDFIDTVLNVRLPNPFMPDTPQRIATDTSQKLSIRFGETIKKSVSSGRDMKELSLIPLVFAGWLRYLMAVDDNGKEFTLSPDPLLERLRGIIGDIKIGDGEQVLEKIEPLFHDEGIFGIDLYEASLAQKVKDYFLQLIAKPGAVRETLKKYV